MAARSVRSELPLVVIVGPTASGKTGLAVDLAERYGGEIICADSRTVYKTMDIGTAKPTLSELQRVPHWGIDLVEPDDLFTAADFQRYAIDKITEIRGRGKIPFLVGGTGLYVDGVIFDYRFGPKVDNQRRQDLMSMSLDDLYYYCKNNNIQLPENKRNKRYIVRAIEQNTINNSSRSEPISNSIIVGIATDRDVLRTRIVARIEQLFENGAAEEAKALGEKYGWNSESMTGNVYRLMPKYLKGELTLDQLKARCVVLDWQLAKRQLTWFRRNKHIVWRNLNDAGLYIASVLDSEH